MKLPILILAAAALHAQGVIPIEDQQLINAARTRLLTAQEANRLLDKGPHILLGYCPERQVCSSPPYIELERRFNDLLLQQFKMRVAAENARSKGKQ